MNDVRNNELLNFCEGVEESLRQRKGSLRVAYPDRIFFVHFDDETGFCLIHEPADVDFPQSIALSLIGIVGEEGSTLRAEEGSADFDALMRLYDAIKAAQAYYPPDFRYLASRLSRSLATA